MNQYPDNPLIVADPDNQRRITEYRKLLHKCYTCAEVLGEMQYKDNLSDQELFNQEAKIKRFITFDDEVENVHKCYMDILHLIDHKELQDFSSEHAYTCLTLVWEIYKLHKLIDKKNAFIYMDSYLMKFFKMLRGIPLEVISFKFFNAGREYQKQFDVFKKVISY